MPSYDEKSLAYSKGKYSPDLKIFLATADATAERVLTPKLGGCYRPVFTRAGDRLYFLREEWPDGPTGVPKLGVLEINLDGLAVRMVADFGLFDDPLGWTSGPAP